MFDLIKEKILARIHRKLYLSSTYRKRNAVDIVKYKSKKDDLVSGSVSAFLLNASKIDAKALLARYGSYDMLGLNEDKVKDLRLEYGLNEIRFNKRTSWLQHLWQCYANPFNLLLTGLGLFEYFTQDYFASAIIMVMILVATFMRFYQERRSKIAMDNLKNLVSNTATVVRHEEIESADESGNTAGLNTTTEEIPILDLVPGDVVLFSAGDMVPADVRILTAKDLFISQSVLSGESMPVEKFAELKDTATTNILNLDNVLFMGSNVVSGSARAVVIATGNKTYFGDLATKIVGTTKGDLTQFQKGINRVSIMLIKLMLVMVPVVFLINGLTKGNWLEAVLFSLSVAVGLTPEMLPMIVTSTLAKGATFMAKKKVIVKKLEALQNFGAMDVLCTDKTGTLTQDKIVLEEHTDIFGEESSEVLMYAHLNSYYQTGLKNLLDVAVLQHVELKSSSRQPIEYSKVDELPFDFNRRRMSVIVKQQSTGRDFLICKGALEEILSICTCVRKHGEDLPLTQEILTNINQTTKKLNQQGLRVVAVAIKDVPHKDVYTLKDENNLTLVGYIAFLDPPKESTEAALRSLAEAGVEVKILTGDNLLVTRKVCKDVNFKVTGALSGDIIGTMTDEDIVKVIDHTNVFVKLTPDHKERLVNLLKFKGHTVGFLGDGINDAPALRASDVGISVDTAVDITRESADLILLEKSLTILEQGIKEGRKTFANMLKYIRMTASSNFGNVFSVLIASVFLPFLPILPVQLLIQNLLYDTSQTVIPFDNVEPEVLKKPQKWDPKSLRSFIMFFGPISSLFDIITFVLLWYVYKANTPSEAAFFQTGWYIEGFISQVLIVHAIRTSKIPFLQSRAAWPLLVMSVAIIAVGLFIPLSVGGASLGFVVLPLNYYAWVGVIVIAYFVMVQCVKRWIYIPKCRWQ